MRELIKAELNKGITQRDLANKLHFSHSTIQKILFTETKHTYDIRKKVADYFGVPVSQFYDGMTSPQESPSPSVSSNPADQITLRDILKIHEQIEKLGEEIGEIKLRLYDASQTGDIKRLGRVGEKGS